MSARPLFNGRHIYDVVEDRKERLKKIYESLSDDQALNEAFTQELKRSMLLDIPKLRAQELTRDVREVAPQLPQAVVRLYNNQTFHAAPGIEIDVYVPFDGDEYVFSVRPSASNGRHVAADIRGKELMFTVVPPNPEFDVAASVSGKLAIVEWFLNSLAGTMEHMESQLEGTLRFCIAARKQAFSNKEKVMRNLNIPNRQSAALLPAAEPKARSKPNPAPVREVREKTWDIFMSHASPDKPWVSGLVKALRDKGITVWYDEDCVALGEPLRQAIKKGLLHSRFGVVVLSKAYLADRKWTEHEFDGLFARERLDNFIILPVWHGVDRDDIEKYDSALADRKGSISGRDGYDGIVNSVLAALGRGHDVVAGGSSSPPIAARPQDGSDKRELVAYAWYEQKGADAEKEKVFIRKSDWLPGNFVLINGDLEHDGTQDDVAGKFFMADKHLKARGFERMNYSNPSNNRAFDLS